MARKDKEEYFDEFEKLTELAVQEAAVLVEAVENFTTANELEDVRKRAHHIENEADEVNHRVFERVSKDFITPIEREDILELIQDLDSIIDHIEEVIIRFYMYDIHLMTDTAVEFAYQIKHACEALNRAMFDFRNFKKSKQFHGLIVEVNNVEDRADHMFIDAIRELHTAQRERPMHVHVWTNIYERMERCCDDCEHAADVMNSIMLKNV